MPLSRWVDRAFSRIPGLPSQVALDQMFACAVSGRLYLALEYGQRNEVEGLQRAEFGKAELAELRNLLKVEICHFDFPCKCLGLVTLELWDDEAPIGTLSPRHERTLQCSCWPVFLGRLRDGTALLPWLERRGVNLEPSQALKNLDWLRNEREIRQMFPPEEAESALRSLREVYFGAAPPPPEDGS